MQQSNVAERGRMKDLLWKRKGSFIKYLVATFMFNIEHFMGMGLFALVLGTVGTGDKSKYKIVIICTIAFSIYSPLSFLISRMFRIGYMRDVILDIRREAFDKIMGMSIKHYSKKSKEIYISNLINDINTFENKFFISLLNFLIDVGMFALSLILLIFLDLKLALAMSLISACLYLLSNKLNKKATTLMKDVSISNEKFTTDMANTFNGMEILKLNNIEKKFLDKSLLSLVTVEKKKFMSNVFTDLQRNVINSIGYVIMVFIMIYLTLNVNTNISLALAAFLFQLSSRMSYNLIGAFPLWNAMKASMAIYDKITKPEKYEIDASIGFRDFEFKNSICATNLTFSYENKKIFENASFFIEKGKKYLIKGTSGAGKSTLMNLLAMTNDEYKGMLKMDGIDYREITEKSFNNKVAFIYQDVFLFEDTIKNNISLYKDIPMEKIEFAANVCGLLNVISDKKGGINTMLTENGKNLSGGQRQRISIARAIAKEAEILFVDEGTSSLNEELGREIEKVFLKLPHTVIAISHRFYDGITDEYDYVLEVKNSHIYQYPAKDYFGEEITC